MRKLSPLTRHQVEVAFDGNVYHFRDDLCGPWAVTDIAFEDGLSRERYESADAKLSKAETARMLAMARSRVWRAARLRLDRPVFITRKGRIDQETKGGQPPAGYVWTSPEDLHEDAQRLTLEQKALLTLEDMTLVEEQPGDGVRVPYLLRNYPGSPAWRTGEPPKEDGITYGSVVSEAPLIYKLLEERRLISIDNDSVGDDGTIVYIRPEGYGAVDQLRAGRGKGPAQAFLICRFTPEMDAVYDSVYRPVGDACGCPVKRVKDIHHVDKIDDRICAEIERTTIVLVDLTDENFNVGFEAGYALALGKTVVWAKRKDAAGLVMPFDIYTYNCIEWSPSDLSAFRETLGYRIQAALEKAARGRA